jgi:hypothetical protein
MAKYGSRSKGNGKKKSRGRMMSRGYFRRGGGFDVTTTLGTAMVTFSTAEEPNKKIIIETLSGEDKELLKISPPFLPKDNGDPDEHEAVRSAAIDILVENEVLRINGLSTDDEKNSEIRKIEGGPDGDFKNKFRQKMSPAPAPLEGGRRRKSKRRKTRRRKTRR